MNGLSGLGWYSRESQERRERATIFNELRQRGITQVVVQFSGGNDEGGADETTVTRADGSTEALGGNTAYKGTEYDHETGKYTESWVIYDRATQVTRPATADEVTEAEFRKNLEEPIYDRWGSFAGEFHVYGTLTWDVATETVKLDGEEEVSHDEHFEYDV